MINQSIVNFVKIYLIVVALVATFLFRYEIVSVNAGDGPSYAYRLDHWTGSMKILRGVNSSPVGEYEASK